MLKKIINNLGGVIQQYGAMAFPIRLAIGGFATLMAGTWLGFIAEYAGYSWAIYYGLRPPLEGIPYLKVAVTGLSVSILLGGAFVYVVVHLVASAILQQAERLIEAIGVYIGLLKRISPSINSQMADVLVEEYRKFPVSAVLLTSFFVACLVVAGMFFVQWLQLRSLPDITEFIGVGILVFVGMLLLWNRNVRIWLALLAVLVVTIVIPVALFHVTVYDNLLRFIGYGGGLPVVVTVVEDPSDSHARTKYDGYLMLRTTSALLLFESERVQIKEIPLQQVLSIDHDAVPLAKRVPQMPR